MTNKKLKIGIVGLNVGVWHITDYQNSPDVGEIVLCDINQDLLNKIGDEKHISKRYTDFKQMLEKEQPDAVSICVPNFLHPSFTEQALKAGCHVLCEKPMAKNAIEAKQMKEASIKYGKKLMINFNQRYFPEYRALKRLIDHGMLGDIYYAKTLWHRTRGVPWWYPLENGKQTCGGGPLIDLGVHVLDRTLWFCGFPKAKWVLGNTYCKIACDEAQQHGLSEFALEDLGAAMILMENGSMIELEASWACNCEGEEITTQLFGTKGGAVLKILLGNETESGCKVFLNENGIMKNRSIELIEEDMNLSIRQDFINAILHDNQMPCTPDQGIAVNEILDAVYKSAMIKGPVRIGK